MLKIYDIQQGRLHEQSNICANSWISLINPTNEEMGQIAYRFQIPTDLIEAALDVNERSRIQQKDGVLLIVSQLPHQNGENSGVPYQTIPLGIIITTQTILTVTLHDHPMFDEIHDESFDDFIGIGQTKFIYRFLEMEANHFLNSIDVINEKVNAIEQELQCSIKNKQVFKLLNNNKSLIAFSNALKSNLSLLNDLFDKNILPDNDETQKKLLNIQIETEQAQVVSETHNANLRNLMDAYSAAIENNLSLVVQYLSIYVIFLAIPMGMAGIYGMNTPLPIQDEPYALAFLIAIAIIVASIIALIFKKRRII